MYANRSEKIMQQTVHQSIGRSLTNYPNREGIVEDMIQRRYIAGADAERENRAWHSFKICNNTLAKTSILYLFKNTQCLEVFSTLLSAAALDQYPSNRAKAALQGVSKKISGR